MTTYDASGAVAGIDYGYYGDYLVSKTDKVSGAVVWQFNASDAWGNITQFTQGNGVITTNVHDNNDGTYKSISSSVQNLEYQFNGIGNLEYRVDNNATMRESFTYDNLNRLDVTTLTVDATSATFNVDYDHLGNITFKTGVGTYHYENGRPHAVSRISGGNLEGSFVYDNNGNMTSGGGRSDIRYNTMDKPTYIKTAAKSVSYQYGMGGSRFKRIDDDGTDITSTLYVGNTEFISVNGTLSEVQRQIAGVALETYFPATDVRKLEYLHYDHLGSIDVITDDNAAVLQKFSYDAWGQRRSAGTYMTGSFSTVDMAISFQRGNFKRGFTGHEHIDDAGLIHMNGRVYDARLGRFMSADPIVSSGDNLQAYNRYSYVLNNPLNATDPSGYEVASIIAAVAAAVAGSYEVYTIVKVALYIYQIYSIGQGVYGAIQAFKYDQGVMGVVALAQSAFSAYSLFKGPGVDAGDSGSELTKVEGFSDASPAESQALIKDTVSHRDSRSLLDGKIKLSKYGDKGTKLSGPEISRVKLAVNRINGTSAKIGNADILPQGKEMFSKLSESAPLKIVLNDSGVNTSLRFERILAIDLNSRPGFYDFNSGGILESSIERVLTHESGHAILGYSDLGGRFIRDRTVVFTDTIMKNIGQGMNTQRLYYGNACNSNLGCFFHQYKMKNL